MINSAGGSSLRTASLRKLRATLKNLKYVAQPLQAYIITNTDAHLSEYLAESDRRLEFMTGFSGSAGIAIITESEAILWTDGRYHIQAQEELDGNWQLMKAGFRESTWLNASLEKGSKIGIDAKYISSKMWLSLKAELEPYGHILVPVATNFIDLIWDERSDPSEHAIHPVPLECSGMMSKLKVDEVRIKMNEKGADILILSALDDIAWLLNLRGSDIPYNPVFFAYVILLKHQIHLFIDERKITLAVRNHFNKEDIPINLHAYDSINSYLTIQIASQTCRKIWIASPCNFELFSLIPDKQRISDYSPVSIMKAIKNETEVKGMVNAHIKDAVALCRYFCWLEKEVPTGKVTEVSASEKLELFRRDEEGFIGPSFRTISSSGPNGAKNHYRPTSESDRPITYDELYLCDSGGQYRDGTTDVTRTLHFGKPSEFQKECFTRVFQGQTALGTMIFPSKVKGNTLDVIARKALWNIGLDYLHSTGHGIGSYLHVHEGPMGIGNKPYPDDPGLQINMFMSNEPGYYQEGEFGIRLENVMQIVPVKTQYNFKNREYLTFNTITLVPIQSKLLVPSLLTKDEIRYLNKYHGKCREIIGPLLLKGGHKDVYEWLVKETEPIC